MLKAIIIGNLGHDPETRTFDSGRVAVSYTVAISNGRGRAPTWVNVTAWDKLGEHCAQYLLKGSKVAVIGRPAARAWTTRDGRVQSSLDVTATEVKFLSSMADQEDTPPSEPVDPATGYTAVDPEDKPW